MKIIPIVTAIATGGVTYYGLNKLMIVPLPVKIGVSVVAGGIGYYGGTKIQNLLTPNEGEKIVGGAKTEKEQLLKKNLTLPPDQQQLATVTPAQMKIYANNLFTAMDGAGTNEDGVKAVIDKMNSDIDILNLIEAFGTRAGTSFWASSTPDDLSTWFEADGITKFVNDILETKSMISYRF